MMEKKIIKLSATALGTSACMLKFHRTVGIGNAVGGYRQKAIPARMVYGIAGHKFIDAMYKSNIGKPFNEYSPMMALVAMKKAFNLPKIPDEKSTYFNDEKHLQTVCMNIWHEWIANDTNFEILELNGKPATEVTFSIKYYEDDYIIVYLEGTLDKLGKFQGGCYAIGDWKFTGAWNNKGYFQQYELARQFRMYRLATLLEAEIDPTSVLGRMGSQNMGIFVDAIFLDAEPNKSKVVRGEVKMLSKDEVGEFRVTLDNWIKRLSFSVAKLQHDDPPTRPLKEGILNGSCEGKWGKCVFWDVCNSPDHVANILLKRDFAEVPFEPSDYNGLEMP